MKMYVYIQTPFGEEECDNGDVARRSVTFANGVTTAVAVDKSRTFVQKQFV